MRRGYVKPANRAAESGGEQGFWPSYADMMSSFALIPFFLMLLAYIQNLITGNNLQSTQETLENTQAELTSTVELVKTAEKELKLITMDLDDAKGQLAEQQGLIAQQEALIADQQALATEQKAKLDEQTALMDQQAKYLASTNKELTEMRSQMQTIAVLRLSILEQIKSSIEDVMGGSGSVSIGNNGSIILSENVLFDYGSSEVKDDSAAVLGKLSSVFVNFLSNSENAKYVDSIVISGHTDSTGSDERNRTLSTERANSVLGYILGSGNGRLNNYAQYFCAAGYGSTRPVANNSTEAGRAANRRIEISIILKDETVMDIVESYLAIDPPAAP